ncbi:sugar ABC transporter ATP-binding protein [Pararhodospirillum photometricum]|uniref:sugar ABC transporter ATP-binding protein n=1 Tax=Pararhodospirillum photometricum TaxID=1084 RepID=UPI0002FEA773|nr:sugar ABC transporter ATP-binding protein [Pararhodospirillum photometricum]
MPDDGSSLRALTRTSEGQSMTYAVEVEGVTKAFGGVRALQNATLRVAPGTIHALVGENGAGKSTLMNILAGILRRDGGQMRLFGKTVDFASPAESQRHGIAIIHQELALAPDLSVAENMFLGQLGRLFVNHRTLNRRAAEALAQFGFAIDPTTPVGALSVAYQQIVEITSALVLHDCKILIMDEPSAVLADPEIEILFANLRRLRQQGVTILYISHRLEEIFRIADAITVFKDGQTVTDLDPRTCTEEDIITTMVGRRLGSLFPPKPAPQGEAEVILRVRNLTRARVLHDVSLHLRRGEILGLAGLVGSGRSEVARCLFGIDRYDSGIIEIDGTARRITRPAEAMRQGIGLVPEDRKRQGGILPMSISENLTLTNLGQISRLGVCSRAREAGVAERSRESLRIRLGSPHDALSSLSGGNQQKVVLAKWLNAEPRVLILDEPTRGVDVGAKAELYLLINDLARRGFGILVISSEMVELVGLCQRVYVMAEGEITGELAGDEIREEAIMRLAIPKRRKTP